MSESTPPVTIPATEEQFRAGIGDLSVEEIKRLVRESTGAEIRASGKDKVLDAAYRAYVGHLKDPAAMQGQVMDPAEPKKPEKPARAPSAEKPAPAKPAEVKPLEYEGRSRTGRPFHKLGRVFGPKWEPIGALTDAERVRLDQYAAHLSIRVRG